MFKFTSLVPNPFASRPPPPSSPEGPPAMETPPPPFPFMRLPLELREQVYSIYFHPGSHLIKNSELEAKSFFGGVYQWDFDLWRVNKQVYEESKKVWKRENVFVKIATPWPSAGMYRVYLMASDGFTDGGPLNHVSSEGLVPIVCTDARADAFDGHHGEVSITAPFHQAVPEHTVVMLVDDLHLFTRTWHYSALSYPMLNDRLNVTFLLRDPDHDPEDPASEEKEIPLALQKKLLLPFEAVKGLHGTQIHGYAPAVQTELARLQALPIPTLQEACETATELMIAGDTNLTSSPPDPTSALELYRKAFHAIHILIHGRTRRVLGDGFFHDAITKGRYAGHTGMTVRVLLRLKLVSRTIAAYNALSQYGEAVFWGLRSINIISESLDTGFEDFLAEFLGKEDVGYIYLRTAIAFQKMERAKEEWFGELIAYADQSAAKSEALWPLAVRFLQERKGDVRKELREHGIHRDIVDLFGATGSAMEHEYVVADDGSSTSEE